MAKKKKAQRIKAKAFSGVSARIDVTPERASRNRFTSAGMARRLVPVIETLLRKEIITQAEYDALDYYRQQASMAERSPMPCVLDRSVGNGGDGPGAALLSAMLETGRIENDLGQLVDIARAVAVDDVTLAQWCIAKFGGRERYKLAADGQPTGEVLAIVPVGEQRNMALARLELRMAAGRIMRR